MIIQNAEFVTSAATLPSYRKVAEAGKPEIVFLGRSNVGKSSFINMLCGRNKLAKTSSAPGRTRLINIFDINKGFFYLVDLPGYGFAAASKTKQKEFSELIESYLNDSKLIAHAFLLVDIRHKPSALDIVMINYLHSRGLPFTIIASKADKLSKAQTGKAISIIASELRVGTGNIIPVSNLNKTGKDKVLDRIQQAVSIASEANPSETENEE